MPAREKYPLNVYNSFGRWQTVLSRNPTPILIVLLFFGLTSYLYGVLLTAEPTLSRAALRRLASYCAEISPISKGEYLERQTKLAHALHSLGGQAYIAEPGAYTQYFANFSKAEWHLSERPLLLIISPVTTESGILPQVTILTPKVASRFNYFAIMSEFILIDTNGSLKLHAPGYFQSQALASSIFIMWNGQRKRTRILPPCTHFGDSGRIVCSM
jgi:hypothetical protein